jgi:hypothetical protein
VLSKDSNIRIRGDQLLNGAFLVFFRIASKQGVFEKLFFSNPEVGYCVMVQVLRRPEDSPLVAQQISDSRLFLAVLMHGNLL